MKIATSITGIGATARDRAAAVVQRALAKREAELVSVRARGSADGGTSTATLQSQGGK